MFAVKYEVQSLEDALTRTKKATAGEEHALRADEAEWAYLTRPEILDEMNRRHLSLGPITTKQLRSTFADIPLRAPVQLSVETSADEPPAEAAQRIMPVAATTPESPERPPGLAETVKRAPARAMAKPPSPGHPRSLDELIARVAASR
jgi:hypothetical protein